MNRIPSSAWLVYFVKLNTESSILANQFDYYKISFWIIIVSLICWTQIIINGKRNFREFLSIRIMSGVISCLHLYIDKCWILKIEQAWFSVFNSNKSNLLIWGQFTFPCENKRKSFFKMHFLFFCGEFQTQ